MPIPVVAYTMGGIVRGTVAAAGHLRDVLEGAAMVEIQGASFATPTGTPAAKGVVNLEPDEILLAVEPDEDAGPVHATWHALHLVVGPYIVDGEMATLPGFDPARALARPSGTFVQLRDAAVTTADQPDARIAEHRYLHVHRYAVEHVDADLMLAFFFPGAELAVDVSRSGAASH